jgi:hypothetical protein
MSEISPQRKKVVVLCAAVALMGGAGPALLKGHPMLRGVWLAATVVALVYAIAEFVKLKRQGQ